MAETPPQFLQCTLWFARPQNTGRELLGRQQVIHEGQQVLHPRIEVVQIRNKRNVRRACPTRSLYSCSRVVPVNMQQPRALDPGTAEPARRDCQPRVAVPENCSLSRAQVHKNVRELACHTGLDEQMRLDSRRLKFLLMDPSSF